jgi:hypothetical protein
MCMYESFNTLKRPKRVRHEKQGLAVPVANVLEGPQVQWTALTLRWDLPVSLSDYHLWDYYQQAMLVYDYSWEIQQVH